jgi:hypothetical protein
MSPPKDFVALILTHARPDRVKTYQTLRKSGYTGPIRVVVDDGDPKLDEYSSTFGDELVVFSKAKAAQRTDPMENHGGWRGVVYARNAAWDVAREAGFTYFIALDDDYHDFSYRFDRRLEYGPKTSRNLDVVFGHLLRFYIDSGCASLAMAQGGDFVGGADNLSTAQVVRGLRKCMNSFVCSTERRFDFLGRINEDTNAYVQPREQGPAVPHHQPAQPHADADAAEPGRPHGAVPGQRDVREELLHRHAEPWLGEGALPAVDGRPPTPLG